MRFEKPDLQGARKNDVVSIGKRPSKATTHLATNFLKLLLYLLYTLQRKHIHTSTQVNTILIDFSLLQPL